STPEDTLLSIAAPGVLANDSDPEGDSLKAILASQAAHGTVTLNISGSFTYLPVHNYAGSDSFTYRPSDNSLSGSVVTVSLTVTPVNDPPVAKDDSYSVAKDTEKAVAAALGVLSNDTDVDSSTISAIIETGPDHGQLTLNADGSFRYLPTTGFIGVDKFTYRASDTQLTSGPATVTLTISDVNHPPVASNDQAGTPEDNPLLIPVSSILANDSDVDGDALSVLLLVGSAPAHGTLTIQPGGSALLYTPDADFNGSDAFIYYASDGHATSNAATVVMTVAPVNDAPSFMKGPDLHLTDESGPQSYPLWATNVSAGPANEAGQSLHFLITTDQAGLFAAGPSASHAGELTFTPAANTSGTATVIIALIDDGGRASDGIDFSQPQIFQISIDKPHPLHNASNPVDSNNDGFIAANDAVLVINYINAQQVSAEGGSGEATGPIDDHDYVDVNGDNYVSAIDALSIINYLNAHPQAAGEAAAPAAGGVASAAAANDLLALLAADTATQASGKRRNS
ncbi:MAG: tandem-95 repeat protein, partial [Planctomycetia bacterium]|nr:tandem-95 repeat protein [Planctomycetia bacterium]